MEQHAAIKIEMFPLLIDLCEMCRVLITFIEVSKLNLYMQHAQINLVLNNNVYNEEARKLRLIKLFIIYTNVQIIRKIFLVFLMLI